MIYRDVLTITMDEKDVIPEVIDNINAILQRYPGSSLVWVYLDGFRHYRLTPPYTVTVSKMLVDDLRSIGIKMKIVEAFGVPLDDTN